MSLVIGVAALDLIRPDAGTGTKSRKGLRDDKNPAYWVGNSISRVAGL